MEIRWWKISILNKESKEDIENSTIEILKEKLWNKMQKEIDIGIDPLTAYDNILKRYELEQEILII